MRYLALATLLFASWTDPSKHTVQLIPVDEGVKLEVLDWGGAGRPVVLLGGYLTAHSYDEFAPKLAESFHVYGITRRGYGASSHAFSGYTAQRSAADVLAVLDALKIEKPILAGHSFGGQDLSTIGATHPERVAGLVYLNSAEDPTLVMSDYGVTPPDGKKLPAAMRNPSRPDLSSFEAYRVWQKREHGVAFPESELRQLYVANPDGSMGQYITPNSIRQAIFEGRKKPDYAQIRVPVLAFFAAPAPFDDLVKKYQPANDEERAAMKQQYEVDRAIRARHRQDLQKGVPSARVVEVPGANFYIFLSNDAEIVREMRAFAAGLK